MQQAAIPQASKITSFTDLITWKEGHKLVLMVYALTDNFPSDEKFALTKQLRTAVVSITSNIAEGFSRRTRNDKIKFYTTAIASLTEVANQLIIAKDLKYITELSFQEAENQIMIVGRLINGLMKSAATK